MNHASKREQFFRFINQLNAYGLDVYVKPPVRHSLPATYGYYTDGKRIAYFQIGHWGGVEISTVHIPNRQTGTGFRMVDATDRPTESQVGSGFAHSPHWAGLSDRESVQKFRDFEDFKNRSLFGGDLTLVTSDNLESI